MKIEITKKKGLISLGAAVAIVLTTAASCDKYTEPFKDAPRSGTDGSPALVIEMPDGFSNISTKCVGDIRYTVTYHGDAKYGAVTTVVDPDCK